MNFDERAAFAEALQQHQAGELEAAENTYRQITAANPNHADALHFLGVIALQKEEPNNAIELIKKAIAEKSDVPEYHMHLGLCLHSLDQPAACEESLRRAVELAPNHADARFNLGQFLMTSERETEAEVNLRKAIEIAPKHARCHNALGTLMIAQNQYTEAKKCFATALESTPEFLLARLNFARCLLELGEVNDAELEAQRCSKNFPDDAAVKDLMARVMRARARYDDAVEIYQTQLLDDADDEDAKLGLGSSLLAAERIDEAVEHYRNMLEAKPDIAQYHYNLGLALRARGTDTEAIDCFNQSIGLSPEYSPAIYMRALTELASGRFEDGLAAYEMRWTDPRHANGWLDLPQEAWAGEEPAEKKLLVWGEQGVGDHILYAGLLPTLLGRGAKFIWECNPRLAPLMRRSFPEIETVELQRPVGDRLKDSDIDFQVPMASLMFHLTPWPEGYTPTEGYLRSDPDRRAAFQSKLTNLGERPKIGISWRSSSTGSATRKSCPLDNWGPILGERDALFVNLQYGDVSAEVTTAANALGAEIYTDPDLNRFDDIDGLFALIDSLDMVITTSSVTAHFAGALGKPTLLMLQHRPIWYWGATGRDVLFYPTITAHRQSPSGGWLPVVEAVGAELAQALANGKFTG